eukprot:scaffold707_cov399-Prasinococcus_capsulatus_cf.AAC.25
MAQPYRSRVSRGLLACSGTHLFCVRGPNIIKVVGLGKALLEALHYDGASVAGLRRRRGLCSQVYPSCRLLEP